ncbi:MAG: hypothetical protein L3K14_03425 [Thermoplasmata archaeon]|nr:hypothetical protein [Thermoplasmata archaeon]
MSRRPGHRRPGALALLGSALLVALLLCELPAAATVPVASAAPLSPVGSADGLRATSASGSPSSASPVGPPTPYCYPIDPTACVAAASSTEPNIVPPAGTTSATVEPTSNTSLPLLVKSRLSLNWTNAPTPHFGPKSPITLNATAVLWNGDPYYSVWDNTVWHSASNNTLWTWYGYEPQNKSYPFWYEVNFSARSPTGPNFFPGMSVTWWLELTYNRSGVFSHNESLRFSYRYAGAWAYSPWPGAKQYAGNAAVSLDLNLSFTPARPNWNDSVAIAIATTPADVFSQAKIRSAYVDLSEVSANGTPLANGTLVYAVPSNASGGVPAATVIVPATWAQAAGATVTYRVTAFDGAADQLTTTVLHYVVGGNGSFDSGLFVDDLALTISPNSIVAASNGPATIPAGQIVALGLTSRDPTSAIQFARIQYSFSAPLVGDLVQGTLSLGRGTSTNWTGALPGLPIDTNVNFTVQAWDFQNRLESSPRFAYHVEGLAGYAPAIPANATFFYVFVYDSGSGTWVNGAVVQIRSPSGYLNSISRTTFGVAYPNGSFDPFAPLLLPANVTYRISVDDPAFVPSSGPVQQPLVLDFPAPHSLTIPGGGEHGTLIQAPTYTVLVEGDALLFWLNGTPPGPAPSASLAAAQISLPQVVGLVAAVALTVPLLGWWGQLRKRRKAEERRITL